MPDWMIQLITAFWGALGFAVLFNVQSSRLFWAGLGGMLGWAAFLVVKAFLGSEVIGYFLGSIGFTLYSDLLARVKKTPTTVFLVPAAIPMVPGASLYRAMSFIIKGQWIAFPAQILYTLFLASAIAGGIVCGMTIIHIVQIGIGAVRKRLKNADACSRSSK